MKLTTIAGFDVDEVVINQDARAAEEKAAAAALEIKQRLADKLKRQKKPAAADPAPAAPTPPVPSPSPIITPSSAIYKDLEWEILSPRDADGTTKTLFTYDKSLERLQRAGYERHPRPQEVFSYIRAGLENKLSPAEKVVYDDFFKSYGEWFSLALERKKDTLICYLDPQGLVWNGRKYVRDNFQFSDEKRFNVKGKNSESYIDLKEFPADLVTYLYGCRFADLPEVMHKGDRRAQLALPKDGTEWPAGRGYFIDYCGVGGFSCGSRSSRGVRRRS